MAQFRLASAYERDGKFSKAFDTYQELIDTYKQSAQFSEAIDRQSAIATQARSEKLGSFFGIPKKLDRTEQIEMFEKVIANAPVAAAPPKPSSKSPKSTKRTKPRTSPSPPTARSSRTIPTAPKPLMPKPKWPKASLESRRRQPRCLQPGKSPHRRRPAAGLFPDTTLPDMANTRAQVDELSAENAWKTGQFYEKQGKYRAALVYYSDVLRAPGSPHFAKPGNGSTK